MTRHTWPFPTADLSTVSPNERAKIGFLKAAHGRGHVAYLEGQSAFGAESASGRTAFVIYRGGSRYWELILLERQQNGEIERRSLYIDGIGSTCAASLCWLDGQSVEEVRATIGEAMVSRPGENGWGVDGISLESL